MKTDRLSSAFIRKTGALLIALLLVAGAAPAGVSIHFGPVSFGINVESHSKKLAAALTPQVKEVQKRFDQSRRALRTVQGPDGKPAYLRKDVAELTARTGEDLDEAIENIDPDLRPLEDWSAAELARIQAEVGTPAAPKTADFSCGSSTPCAVAVVASLSSPAKHASSKAKAVAPKPVAPPPDTVPAEKSNSVLDQVEKVVSQIFALADHNDLEVDLWVGSTGESNSSSAAPHVQLLASRQDQGFPGAHHPPACGKKDHIIRGLYFYEADLGLKRSGDPDDQISRSGGSSPERASGPGQRYRFLLLPVQRKLLPCRRRRERLPLSCCAVGSSSWPARAWERRWGSSWAPCSTSSWRRCSTSLCRSRLSPAVWPQWAPGRTSATSPTRLGTPSADGACGSPSPHWGSERSCSSGYTWSSRGR